MPGNTNASGSSTNAAAEMDKVYDAARTMVELSQGSPVRLVVYDANTANPVVLIECAK